MAISKSDEFDLLVPLYEGILQEPRWQVFLERLRRRLRADHVSITLAQNGARMHRALHWFAGVDLRTRMTQLTDPPGLDAAYAALRPNRVYREAELVTSGSGDEDGLRNSLRQLDVRFGRYMRVGDVEGRSGWLDATRNREDFNAADGTLMSSLAPHLSVALRTLGEIERARFRGIAGEEALSRAGIAWRTFCRDGQVLESGGCVASGHLQAIEHPAPATPHVAPFAPVRLALSRAGPLPGQEAADALTRWFGLSRSEALLAIQLVRGSSLAEAADTLGLTLETVRNYSKRIFAKTGTRGQADLVRMILSGAAGLA